MSVGANDNELNAVDTWLFNTLSTLPRVQQLVGRHPQEGMWQVYENVAPQGATYPHIVSKFKAGVYRKGAEGRKVFLKATYDIAAYTQKPTYADVAELSGIIQGELHRDQLSDVDVTGTVAGCQVVAPIKGDSTLDGVTTRWLGAKFEIMAYVVNQPINDPGF